MRAESEDLMRVSVGMTANRVEEWQRRIDIVAGAGRFHDEAANPA